jgi:phosphatidylserine/phosphatidylglycerophosphate/cardiolipin synthase-like enzyme
MLNRDDANDDASPYNTDLRARSRGLSSRACASACTRKEASMTRQYSAAASSGGFTVKAYAGDRCVMLAFDLDEHQTDRLAGFSIARRRAGQARWQFLGNRLGFAGDYTDSKASRKGKFFSSNTDPFQKFWWLDFPPEDAFGAYEYRATVKRFKSAAGTDLADDQQVDLAIDVSPFVEGSIEIAFTRGYLSSQAYADKFKNARYAARPDASGWRFDTSAFQPQWAWLGGHARQAIIGFFEECRDDPKASLDAFVYDLNEPDIIQAFITLAPKLRILSDNSATHADDTAAGKAYAAIVAAGAKGVRGKFGRFQHNKVLVKRVDGKPAKVLTGSTNFSVTGIYVNANHVVVFDDPAIAAEYAKVFDVALAGGLVCKVFQDDAVAKSEATFTEPGLPRLIGSYAPHKHPTFSLGALLGAVKAAKSSVIFAVMDLDGKGELLSALKALHARKDVFSYGISDSAAPDFVTIDGTTVYTPTSKGGELVYSKADPESFPPPFSMELQISGAAAHVVHHKFVIVDFNGDDPCVFCGSSNLAEGGEEANGDNLIAIHDRAIATAFAIEGIRLVDHYAFAAALKAAGQNQQPLRLKTDPEEWWAPYYQSGSIKETERRLFAR